MIKFLDLYSQYLSIESEIQDVISAVIKKSAFIGGEYCHRFEQEFARYSNVAYCVGVANGTDALEIAIEALNLPPGSEILVPCNSFISSSEAVTRQGHNVVFVDCNEKDYTVCPVSLRAHITDKTRAIIAVHLYGHPCDMDELLLLAAEYDLKIVEDCAQAHGAEYKGHKIGSIGDIATFSFYPGKNLGAYGDGGAITTNSKHLADACRKISNHGRLAKYNHEFEARNSRLDGMQAAILSVKLKYLDEWTDKRIMVANLYSSSFADINEVVTPTRRSDSKQVYHLYVIRTNRRDQLKKFLMENNIETGIHYPIALPKLPAYSYINQETHSFFGYDADATLLSLPIGEHMSIADAEQVADCIRNFFLGDKS